jgi:predicted nucleotidyltransferase
MLETDKKTIVCIISKYIPTATIYLFGSRARQTHTQQSDIDIAIDIKQKIDPFVLSEIRESIEESLIPFTVDVVDINNISQELKEQILQDKITWKE